MAAKENNSFWVSYSDLATGLMIVFMLIMLIMMIMQQQATEVQSERISEITAKIEIILGQKSKLSESINKAFSDNPSVRADPVTAQISIDQNALQFNENEASLSTRGQRFLNEFTPQYICSLWKHEVDKCQESNKDCLRLDPELPGGVRHIYVTGHADMKGLYKNNHALSSQRAEEVTAQMLAALSQKNAVMAKLPTICQNNQDALRAYAEERLWAIGAGETQHCTEKLNSGEAPKKGTMCDAIVASDDSFRRVDFGLELTGDDMTGLLADMTALRKEVGHSEEADRIDKLSEIVSSACWEDPSKYHGCKVFARDCLDGMEHENCSKFILNHRSNLKIHNLIRRICRQEKLKHCPH